YDWRDDPRRTCAKHMGNSSRLQLSLLFVVCRLGLDCLFVGSSRRNQSKWRVPIGSILCVRPLPVGKSRSSEPTSNRVHSAWSSLWIQVSPRSRMEILGGARLGLGPAGLFRLVLLLLSHAGFGSPRWVRIHFTASPIWQA